MPAALHASEILGDVLKSARKRPYQLVSTASFLGVGFVGSVLLLARSFAARLPLGLASVFVARPFRCKLFFLAIVALQ